MSLNKLLLTTLFSFLLLSCEKQEAQYIKSIPPKSANPGKFADQESSDTNLVSIADHPTPKKTVCLNMIVKNESKVIRRCLDNVKPLIDYWVIVDTGSTDGTQKIIKNHLKDIPGKLYERPWRNFGENRTEALDLAQGTADYILFMDADDTLEFTGEIVFPELTADLYHMWRGTKAFSYQRPQLIKSGLPWKSVGVTHEYLDCSLPYTSAMLENVRYVSGDGGARSVGIKKFLVNIDLLEDGIAKEPNNTRYAFYLAESYKDAGQKAKAVEWYQKRISMGGWDEEVFWSKLQLAHMLQDLGIDTSLVIEAYRNAHNFRYHRAEPIYYLAALYNAQGSFDKAYSILKTRQMTLLPKEKDILFNEDWIQEYGLLFQFSICSYYVGEHQESLDACNKLLTMENLPQAWRTITEKNRTFPIEKLGHALRSQGK